MATVLNTGAVLAGAVVLMTGCGGSALRTVPEATDADKAALLDRMKSLAGEWESADEKGQKHVSSVFTVSSGGSAVREVMLPGSPHEMTNMYTMDGPTLLATHYCAMGNQPHMRASRGAADRIDFHLDGVSDLHSADGMFMGELTIVFTDKDHIAQVWRHYEKGKLAGEPTEFKMSRKK